MNTESAFHLQHSCYWLSFHRYRTILLNFSNWCTDLVTALWYQIQSYLFTSCSPIIIRITMTSQEGRTTRSNPTTGSILCRLERPLHNANAGRYFVFEVHRNPNGPEIRSEVVSAPQSFAEELQALVDSVYLPTGVINCLIKCMIRLRWTTSRLFFKWFEE